ncbi:aldo/keto reductase [Ktedonosporobacter rubrisoli]|uniref:Aldo/keto reductase n=1 Tax=Ktedonosporobacter rubrisoli TaxID=2509675 RepID=A0A4P6JPG3_KTERU|nr:aldo/keto reductase [Ktedonosporobacter rubrisoli]QBD77165.1 aldo/keto reductase [Ktedonosporobacter rubrisoli]
MSLTSYVTLGHSGLRVSPFCLGGMSFGEDLGWGSSVQESEAIISRYLQEGGNFIDTANIYTRGHSEKIIGDFFAQHKGRRDRVVIATKFFCNLWAGDPNGGGGSRKAIIAQCEESLRRLQTDYIDLYYLHNWDRFTPVEETMRALEDLVRTGKVRYIGFSDAPAWKVAQAQMIAQFRGWAPLIALQIEYSLLQRTVEGELIPMAQELGLGVLPWGPLKGGILSGKYTRENHPTTQRQRGASIELTDKDYTIIDQLQKFAVELGAAVSTVALAWVQSQPGVTSTIIGARTMEHLEANLNALDVHLTPEQIATLNAASKPELNFPAEFNANRSPNYAHAGATVNGMPSQLYVSVPTNDAQRY